MLQPLTLSAEEDILILCFELILPIIFNNQYTIQTTWSASWEICMQVRRQQLELDMEQQTGSK